MFWFGIMVNPLIFVNKVQTFVNLLKLKPLQFGSSPHISQQASGWTPSKVPNIDAGVLSVLNRVSLENEQNEVAIRVTVVVVGVVVEAVVVVVDAVDVTGDVVWVVWTVVLVVDVVVVVVVMVVVAVVAVDIGVNVVVIQGGVGKMVGYIIVGRIMIFCLIPE